MTDEPDYTTMSGAQFQASVGADPEKWAAAFCANAAFTGHNLQFADVLAWFADAMAAAVKAHGTDNPA